MNAISKNVYIDKLGDEVNNIILHNIAQLK